LVAKFQELFADGFYIGVVQQRWIRAGRGFDGTGVAGIPAEGEMQVPGSAVGSKEGVEGGELEPSDIEFAGVFAVARWDEPVCVGAPERGDAPA
jgi:hypothetical protein